jgi:GT2 family glycosyltransferase
MENFPTQLTLSVIIPVHKGGEAFRAALSSLAELNPPPLEVIVAVDGQDDASRDLARKMGMRVVQTEKRLGPAGARNHGTASARGDILLFLDADVSVPPDIIARVCDIFEHNPHLAAVMGSYDDEPAAKNFLSQYRNLLHHYVHQTSREEASTFWAGCGAVRRKVFVSLGGFNLSYSRPSIEDIEFGYRLRRLGYTIRLEKSLQVKHLKQWSGWSLVRTDFLNRALPWSLLILKEGRFPNDLNICLSSRISVATAYLLVASLVLAGWWHHAFYGSAFLAAFYLSLNGRLYEWFRRKRGWSFSFKVLPWHFVYYFTSGLAFAVALIIHLTGLLLPEECKHWLKKHGLAGGHGEAGE